MPSAWEPYWSHVWASVYLSLDGSWASPVAVSPTRILWRDLAHHMPYLKLLTTPYPGPALHTQPDRAVLVSEGHGLHVGHPDATIVSLWRLLHSQSSLTDCSSWWSGGPGLQAAQDPPRAQGPWDTKLLGQPSCPTYPLQGSLGKAWFPPQAWLQGPWPDSLALTWHTLRAREAVEDTRRL